MIVTLQKSLKRAENSEKKLKKQLDILKTQKDFLDNQLQYSEKKSEKKESINTGLRTHIELLKKNLQKVEEERNEYLRRGIRSSSQLSKDIYETGGQSALMELAIDKFQTTKAKNQSTRVNFQI